MPRGSQFGEYCRAKRLERGMTLRRFCQEHGFDAAYMSRLERGVVPPPRAEKVRAQLAKALGLKEGSDTWNEFYGFADLCAGRLPDAVRKDERVLGLLPVFFRAIGKADIDEAGLNRLIEKLKQELP